MFFVFYFKVSISSSFTVPFNKVGSFLKLGYVNIYSAETTTHLVVKRGILLLFFEGEVFLKQNFSIFMFLIRKSGAFY